MHIALAWRSFSADCSLLQRRQTRLDRVKGPGPGSPQLAQQPIDFTSYRPSVNAPGENCSHAGGLAFDRQPESFDLEAKHHSFGGCAGQVKKEVGQGHVLPGVEDVVALAVVGHSSPVAVGGFKMMDGIGSSDADDVAGIVEACAKILL